MIWERAFCTLVNHGTPILRQDRDDKIMRSMTGYGRGSAPFDGRQIAVEMSSVNRKQAEIALTLPRALLELEPRVRDEINAHLHRGRLTVSVALHGKNGGHTGAINLPAAKAYRDHLEALRKSLKLGGEITLDHILRGPGVLDSEITEVDTDLAWPALQKALRAALERFVQMRKKEGKALAADLKPAPFPSKKALRKSPRSPPK